jgi:Uma2 family endonuclease
MKTILKIGPADSGRPMSFDDFASAEWEEGYRYELIDGELYVAPMANAPENRLEEWIGGKLYLYSHLHPEVINFVSAKARVFVPGRPGVTVPEPDRVAFRDYPLGLDLREVQWDMLCPVLVVEVLIEGDPDKDLVRNVDLYLQVPTIREYWILDGRIDPNQPALLVYRRRGRAWQRLIEVPFGATYTTKLLPGFQLVVDPRV